MTPLSVIKESDQEYESILVENENNDEPTKATETGTSLRKGQDL